jgi:U3 small nucleolar RNA-associated protein 20
MQAVQWATEVASVLRAQVGDEAYAAAFQAARASISASKSDRKRALALQVALDPEGAAKRRMKKNEKKSAEKKRKAGAERTLREAGARVAGGGRRKRPRTSEA